MSITGLPPYNDKNIFARILRGDLPCEKIYEDDFVFAFRDIHPQAPTHVLVIPKRNYVSLIDFGANATTEEMAGLMRGVSHVAKKLSLEEDGYRVVVNVGQNGHQEVSHLHVHLLGGRQFTHELVLSAPGKESENPG